MNTGSRFSEVNTEYKKNIGRCDSVSVDVIIPTYHPDQTFAKLLKALHHQSYPIDQIIVFNTEERFWPAGISGNSAGIRLHHISKGSFDHGGTRHEAALLSEADIMVFMTQDAVPADEYLIERLTAPIRDGRAEIAYARQLPRPEAGIIERTGRKFNYPPESGIKTIEDAGRLGIKTFFCSDVCAAYDRGFYLKNGGFPRPVIFNEDMIFAGKALQAGGRIAYTADARVIHSHSLSLRESFKRNFDLGVSQKDHAWLFDRYPSENEGKRLIRETAGEITKARKYYLLFPLFFSGVFKYAGYRFGKHYRKLPKKLVKRFSSNDSYWDRKDKKYV